MAPSHKPFCHGQRTVFPTCIADIHIIVNNIKSFNVATERQKIFPCRATEYFELLSTVETSLGLHMECQILLSTLNQMLVILTDFRKSSQYEIERIFVQWEPYRCMQTDRWTDMKKRTGTFRYLCKRT